jgi:hypothetical protein
MTSYWQFGEDHAVPVEMVWVERDGTWGIQMQMPKVRTLVPRIVDRKVEPRARYTAWGIQPTGGL